MKRFKISIGRKYYGFFSAFWLFCLVLDAFQGHYVWLIFDVLFAAFNIYSFVKRREGTLLDVKFSGKITKG
jgi:hypothetical protein